MSHHNIEDFKPLSVSPKFGVLARPTTAHGHAADRSSTRAVKTKPPEWLTKRASAPASRRRGRK